MEKIDKDVIKDADLLVATVNDRLGKLAEMMGGKASKEDWAKMVVENKEILKNIDVQNERMDKLFKDLEKATTVAEQQGAVLSQLKQAWTPQESKKSFHDVVKEEVKKGVFNDWLSNKSSMASFQIDLKDVASGGTYVSGAATSNYMPFQAPQLADQEAFDSRLLLPTLVVDRDTLDFPQETSGERTDATDTAAENGDAGESTFGFEMVQVTSKRITAFVEVSKRALRSSPWLDSWISNTLLDYGIKALNTQIIAGGGTGNDVKGLQHTDNNNTFAAGAMAGKFANADYFSVMRAARALMVKTYKRNPNTAILDPFDYAVMADARNTIGDFLNSKTFLTSNNLGYQNVSGMNLVESADITDGGYLIGDIQPSTCQLCFNGPIEIVATDSHSSNFIKNVTAIKIEMEVLLPVYNTNAFMIGTLETDKGNILAGA